MEGCAGLRARPPEPMRRLLTALALSSAALTGCARHASDTAAPLATGRPPALLATQPAARSTSVLYDTDIWAQFDRPLDGRTVSPLTVFLKLDGQRVAITTNYDGITRRIFVHPIPLLELQRTYTVEFSPGVKGFDGTPLPTDVFYQFTTNSLRRVVYDYPVDDALEGPVTCLGWGGTKGPDGNILYDVYAAEDSTAVARRSVPSLEHSVFTRHLPSLAWPLGARMFWAVTSENVTTHERLDGEVHSFHVLDAGTPMDSLVIIAQDYGSNWIRNANLQYCSQTTLPSGPSYNAGFHWGIGALGDGVRLASTTLSLYFVDTDQGKFAAAQPSLWLTQNDWLPCSMRAPGPPFNETTLGRLANGFAVDNFRTDFDSDRLAAMFEAQLRHRTLIYGPLVRSLTDVFFHSPLGIDPSKRPRVVARFYRVPPSVAR